jgi:hypothetical protein
MRTTKYAKHRKEFTMTGWKHCPASVAALCAALLSALCGNFLHAAAPPPASDARVQELQNLRWGVTDYGPVEYIWFDHAVGDGGLSHADTVAFCKALQPACFIGFNHGDQTGADIRLGEMGRPGPLDDHKAAGPHRRDAPATSDRLAEFTCEFELYAAP